MSLPYRHDIDGLRAIAILLVMAFHAFPEVVTGGFLGVDVFFVISGFLISSILFQGFGDNSFSFCEFYVRRVRRLFPALGVVLASSLVLGWWLLLPFELKNLGHHVAGGSLFLSNFFLYAERGYFDADSESRPLLHLWSLGIEEQFYLTFPLFLWLMKRVRLNPFAGTAVIATLSLVCQILLAPKQPSQAFYLPHARFWELLAGALLAHAALHFQRPQSPARTENVASAAGLLLIVLGAFSFNGSTEGIGRLLMPVAGTALVIAAGPAAWTNSRVLSHRTLGWLGKISYPLYLWHWLLLSFAGIMLTSTPPVSFRVAALAVALALAWLTYRFVECPVRFGSLRRRSPAMLVASLVVVGLAGILVHHRATSFRRPLPSVGKGDQLKRFDRLASDPEYFPNLRNQRQWAVRNHKCLPNPDYQPVLTLEADCLKVDSRKPNVLVVGDSTAADLTASLRTTHPHLNFLQITAMGCHPSPRYVKSWRRPFCAELYHLALALAGKSKIDSIILGAQWADEEGFDPDFASLLHRFRALTPHMLMVGPMPRLPKRPEILLGRRRTGPAGFLLMERDLPRLTQLNNDQMRAFATAHGVEFVDRLGYFCSAGKCALLSDEGQSYFVDDVHLSAPGMRYFGKRIYEDGLLATLSQPAGQPKTSR